MLCNKNRMCANERNKHCYACAVITRTPTSFCVFVMLTSNPVEKENVRVKEPEHIHNKDNETNFHYLHVGYASSKCCARKTEPCYACAVMTTWPTSFHMFVMITPVAMSGRQGRSGGLEIGNFPRDPHTMIRSLLEKEAPIKITIMIIIKRYFA